MPGITGIELLQQALAVDDAVGVIVLTGAADVKTAIASLKLGAHDFIMKPVNMDELLIATERALERRQLLIDRREYHKNLERRVVEATRDLASKHSQLQETRSEEHTSELQSPCNLVCRLLLEKKKKNQTRNITTSQEHLTIAQLHILPISN